MRTYFSCILFLALLSCLEAPPFRGALDADGGIEAFDLSGGEEGGGEGLEALEIAQEDEGPADPGEVEVFEVETFEEGGGQVCQTDDDCLGGPRSQGPCKAIKCVDGKCVVENAAEGTPCLSDGNPCTVDECDGSGECLHKPITCKTPPEPSCEGNTLVTWASPGECVKGECVYTKVEKTCQSQCSLDGGAHCVGENPCQGVECPEPPSPCFKEGQCQSGTCVYDYNDGVPCDDGNLCTTKDTCNQGVCAGLPLVCDNSPPPYCKDSKTLVTYGSQGVCVGGECEYGEVEVSCKNGCTEDGGIAHCLDQDPCEGVDCSKAPLPCLKSPGRCVNGACVFEFAEGDPCEDGDLCTKGDHCEGGMCVSGSPITCEDDGNVCTDEVCNSKTGKCEEVYNEAQCDDGNSCTTEDKCSNGECKGRPVECNSPPPPECADFLHLKIWNDKGECNERTGECVYGFTLSECQKGWCSNGKCVTEGMTVFGFLEAGGGHFEGLTLSGTLGMWLEGGLCSDGKFYLGAGW